jgi:hypothetical protein
MAIIELELHRVEMDKEIPKGRKNRRTRGTLFFAGEMECHTMEDEVRAPGVKIKGKTAIPAGRYHVVMTWSPKNEKIMPRLVNVPMFDGILIHPGHDEVDTEGCLMTAGGFDRDGDIIGGTSKPAFDKLAAKLAKALLDGEVWITITNDFQNV